jgi:hypothetical protein
VLATILPQLMLPGATVAVRIGPEDHSRIALSLGEQPPTVTIASSGDANTGSAARILEQGVSCKAVIVQSQPLGMRNPKGDDMYAFALTIMAEGVLHTRSRSATRSWRRPCHCSIRATPCPRSGWPTATTARW